MKNGKEIRPNGHMIIKRLRPDGYYSYIIEGDLNGCPWDFLRNARRRADSLPRCEQEEKSKEVK